MARIREPSVVHSIKRRDPRTSTCGVWWWKNGGTPAQTPAEVTCAQCRRSRPEAHDFPREDRGGRSANRPDSRKSSTQEAE